MIPRFIRNSATSRNCNTQRFFSSTKSTSEKLALVLGSNGALGSAIVSHLRKSTKDTTVIGADVTMHRDKMETDAFISLKGGDADAISAQLENGFLDLFESKPEFDAIICANGGFAMDNDDLSEKMMNMNFDPTAAACSGQILPYMTEDNGLFVAFGAVAAQTPVDDDSPMKAYIHSKKEVHDLIQNLGSITGKALQNQKGAHVAQQRKIFKCLDELTAVAILPSTLDTEMNRKSMDPSPEDLEGWTKLEDVAKEIGNWIEIEDLRPHSGALIKCVTERSETDFIISR